METSSRQPLARSHHAVATRPRRAGQRQKGAGSRCGHTSTGSRFQPHVTANEAMAAHGSGSELLVECERQVCSSSGGIGTAYSSLPAALERSSPYPAKPCQIGGCRLDKDLRQVAICLSKTHATLSAAPSERNKSKTFNASTGNKKVQLPTILQEITVDRKN